MKENTAKDIQEASNYLIHNVSYGSVLMMAIAVVIAYWLSQIIGNLLIKIAQFVAVRSDNSPSDVRQIRLRRVETYLSISVALIRAVIVAVVAYWTWRLLNPNGSETLATIGASTLFVVIAGGTIGTLLKDVMAGSNMIIEQWFNIGDYVKIVPFTDVAGVVERATLRSTKLRSINGETIWLHNQFIQGVRVTPRGVRTIAVDVFVRDKDEGEREINKIIDSIPTGPLMLASKLKITNSERWADELWRITVIGQTSPEREWLIDKYFVDALATLNNNLMVQEPITRFADPMAEKRFRRAVRVKK